MVEEMHKGLDAPVSVQKRNDTFWLCFIMGALLCLRAISDIFVYPAALFGLATMLLADPANSICVLFFTLPLGSIFKMAPGQFSFFTLMFLVFAARLVIKKGINVKVLATVLIFGAYLLLISGYDQLINIITIMMGLLLVYYISRENVEFSKPVISFSFGVTVATVLGLLQEQLPLIGEYIKENMLKVGHEEYVSRFAGLKGNPNYYTMDVVLALAGLAIIMMTQKKASKLSTVLFGALTVFGFLSISKSFLLAWAILLVWMVISSTQLNAGKLIKTVLIIGCLFAVVYLFAEDSINAYIIRFTQDEGATVSDMTTGRTDIWKNYFSAIWQDIKILLVGNGVGGELVNGKGAHNAYIEIIYTLGMIGTPIYLYAIGTALSNGHARRKIIQYAPLVVLIVRMFGIGIFTDDAVWFYWILIGLALKEEVTSK